MDGAMISDFSHGKLDVFPAIGSWCPAGIIKLYNLKTNWCFGIDPPDACNRRNLKPQDYCLYVSVDAGKIQDEYKA